MVLIISEKGDYSTKDIIDWLVFYGQPFLIIQPDDTLIFKFINSDYFIEIDEKEINLDEITAVWYRRGWLNLKFEKTGVEEIDRILIEERIHVSNFLYSLLYKKKHLNKRAHNDINKLIVLDIAKKHGILVPKEYYNSLNSDIPFQLITKSIAGSGSFLHDDEMYISFTQEVDLNNTIESSENSYFQEKIDKKYELRIFYLEGKFWSMAIFSQKDEQTKVDFRVYNREKPNRTVPYKLPKDIETKLDKLMRELQINSGSIDMIVTPDNNYYFLEINPIGQFSMTSFPCNYHLELEIANFLLDEK